MDDEIEIESEEVKPEEVKPEEVKSEGVKPKVAMLMTTKVERYTDYALKKFRTRLANDGLPYCYIDSKENRLAYSLRGKWTRSHLRKAAKENGELLRNDDLNEVIENVFAYAELEEEQLIVYLRVGKNAAGEVELDLGNTAAERVAFRKGKAVLVKSGSKTLFSRPETMRPLPKLGKKGNWKLILPFLNMSTLEQYLVIAWMLYSMTHPRGQSGYPILIILGPQGSGKSQLSRGVIRLLVDPNVAGIQLLPGNIRDMAISARSQYVLLYDNVRVLTKKQSDDHCIMSTGGSYSSRKLYTDHEEVMLPVHSPVVINGIHNFVEEPDLASRALIVHAQSIDATSRREESAIARDLDSKLSDIFTGLLDLAAQALEAESTAVLLHPERLMDFCRWLAALEAPMGLALGVLQKAYSDNLRDAALESIRESALAMTVFNFIRVQPGNRWTGTATALLGELNKKAPPQTIHRQAEWPQNPIALGKRLTSIEAVLKPQGITIGFSHGTQRQIEIAYNPPVSTTTPVELDEPDEVIEGDVAPLSLAACEPSAELTAESIEE